MSSSVETNVDNAVVLKGGTKKSKHPVAKLMHVFFKLGDKFFIKKAGKLASNLWFKPRKFAASDSEIIVLNQAEQSSYCLGKDKVINYYRWGSSDETILLVHGWEGRASQFYQYVLSLIQAGYSVVAFDAPGHGLSQGRDSDILEFHQIMTHLQDIFGQFSALIAHSFGAICATYSINNGINTDKIITISTPSHFKGLVYKFQAILGLTDKVTNELCKNIEARFNHLGTNIWQEFSTYVNARNATTKALIIHDKNDKEVPYEESVLIHDNWPLSKLILTEGLGHKRILKDSATIDEVVRFLANTQAKKTVLD